MIEQIITSSILIIAVLGISFVIEKRINPCIKYGLWLLVAIKLLVPLPEFESVISVMNAANKIEERSVRYFFVNNEDSEDQDIPSETYGPDEETEKVYGKITQSINVADICFWVWLAGALSCAGVFLWSNLRFAGRLRKDRVKIGRVQDKINVYMVTGLESPCLFGLFKPSVYLQEGSRLSEKQREFVLAHEYTHYRHGDHVWTLIRCMCIIFYWYDPLVWMAAYRSIKDSELACDAGTLKIIGYERHIEYGKALIEIAKGMQHQSLGIRVLGCSTSATGGIREMKKRMRMIVHRPRTKIITLLVLVLVCVSIVGCTFGGAVSERDAQQEEDATNADDSKDEILTAVADDGENRSQPEPEEAIQDPDNMMYEEVILYRQAESDKVCIYVEPSVLRDYQFYYYIPEDEEQEWIQEFMDTLPSEGKPYAGITKGMKETGWKIVWQDKCFWVFEGGYLYYLYDGETVGSMEYFVEAPKLCDYIQIMLQEKLDYYQFDPADIKNIVSAKLDVCGHITNGEFYSQTITDEETLKKFEDWFSNAEYIYGGAGCANEDACLELVLASGERVWLSIATDSCSNFGINGVYYDYRPTSVWDNREFYECFNEIPIIW